MLSICEAYVSCLCFQSLCYITATHHMLTKCTAELSSQLMLSTNKNGWISKMLKNSLTEPYLLFVYQYWVRIDLGSSVSWQPLTLNPWKTSTAEKPMNTYLITSKIFPIIILPTYTKITSQYLCCTWPEKEHTRYREEYSINGCNCKWPPDIWDSGEPFSLSGWSTSAKAGSW